MATTATIVSFLLNQQRDSATALANGTVTFYSAGTTAAKTIWTDNLKTAVAANPYTLDARGAAVLYGDGNYKVVLKDSTGVTVATWDNVYIGSDLSALDLSSVIAAASFTNRDYIGNSRFNIWNGGTSFTRTTGTATATATGWYSSGDGSTFGSITISRQSFTYGQTAVPENPVYYTKLNRTAAGSGATYENFAFRLPIQTSAGVEMTLRLYAKAAAPKDITIIAKQYFGSGGSATVTTSSTASTLTTSWVKYNKTFTVPSIAGKTVGSGAYLEIGISLPTNDTFNIDVADFKFETGTVAGDNEYRTTYEDDLRTTGQVGSNNSYLIADTNGGTNEKYWKLSMDYTANTLTIAALDDAQANPKTALRFTRSGTTVTLAELVDIATPAGTDDSEKVATTAFVQQVAMNTALPSQTPALAGAILRTNGTDAEWAFTAFDIFNLSAGII
jgi:hypothetical protein